MNQCCDAPMRMRTLFVVSDRAESYLELFCSCCGAWEMLPKATRLLGQTSPFCNFFEAIGHDLHPLFVGCSTIEIMDWVAAQLGVQSALGGLGAWPPVKAKPTEPS